MMLSYVTIVDHYTLNFHMVQHKYSLADVKEMHPYQRELYLELIDQQMRDEQAMLESVQKMNNGN